MFTSLTTWISWCKQWTSHHRKRNGTDNRCDEFPLKKKKRNSSQGNSPTPCFQSQDSESNHTCIWGFLEWPLRHQNLPKITKMFVLSWESGDVSISAFRPLFLISRQHLIKHLECGLRAATALPKPVLRGFPRASFPTIAAETLRGA